MTTAPSRSGWSTKVAPTLRLCSTATRQWRGASSEARRNCRISSTTRSRGGARQPARLPPDMLLRRQALSAPRRLRSRAQGALDLIAKAGGGVVEAYPQDTGGKKITASFLYSVTRSLFEQAGFSYVRPKGKNHTVMRKRSRPRGSPAPATPARWLPVRVTFPNTGARHDRRGWCKRVRFVLSTSVR